MRLDYSEDAPCSQCAILCMNRMYEPTSGDFEVPAQNNIDRFRVCQVFLLQNSHRQSMFIVTVEHRRRSLYDNCSVIEFFVDKVHGAAGDLYAISEGLLLGFEAGKCGQQ